MTNNGQNLPSGLSYEEWYDIMYNQGGQVPRNQMTDTGIVYETPGQATPDYYQPQERYNPDGTIEPMFQWDYKAPPTDEYGRPLDPDGNPLPDGAEGFKPNGEVYWGQGFKNWWRGFMYRAFESQPDAMTPEEEQDERDWEPSVPLLSQFRALMGTNERFTQTSAYKQAEQDFAEAGMDVDDATLGQFVGDLWRKWTQPVTSAYREAAVSDRDTYTVFGRIGKVFGETAMAGLTAFGLPANLIKRGPGTVALTVKDLAGDDAFDLGDWQVGSVNFNWVWELSPVALTWNAIAATQQPAGYSNFRDVLKENYEASRMLYTALEDVTAKEEAIRRMKAGEDAYLVTQELQNPWTELVGEMVLDPLNFPIGKAVKGLRATDRISTARQLMATGAGKLDEIVDAIRYAGELDNVERAKFFTQLVDEQMRVATNTADMLDKTAKEAGLLTLTSDGKRYVYANQMAEATKWLYVNHTRDIDDPFQVMKHLANLHSGDRQLVEASMKAIMESKAPRVLLSEGFQNLGKVLHDTLFDPEEGAIVAEKFLERLNEAAKGGVDPLLEFVEKTYRSTLDEIFPSIPERADAIRRLDEIKAAAAAEGTQDLAKFLEEGEELSKMERLARLGDPGKFFTAVARSDKLIKSKIYQPINVFYAHVYMGLSPGYAVRNWLSNTMHILMDEGWAAWGKGTMWDSGSWIPHASKWLGGVVPQTMSQGIAKGLYLEGGVEALEKGTKWTRTFLDAAQRMELGASRRVVGVTVERTMNQLLRRGAGLPDGANLLRAGFSDDALRHIEQLIVDNFGDVELAVQRFLENTVDGVTTVRVRDTLKYLSPDDRKVLQKYGELQSLLDISKAEISKEDAARLVDEWFDQRFESVASEYVKEIPPISRHSENFEEVSKTKSYVDEGLVRAEVASVKHVEIMSNSQAAASIETLANAVNRQVSEFIASGRISVDDYNKMMAELKLRNPEQAKLLWTYAHQRARNFTDDVYNNLYAQIKNAKGSKEKITEALKRVWGSIGAPGEQPAQWTKEWMRNYLWDVYWPHTKSRLYLGGMNGYWSSVNEWVNSVDGLLGGELFDTVELGIGRLYTEARGRQRLAAEFSSAVYEKNVGWRKLRDVQMEMLERGEYANAVRTLASRYGVASITDSGVPYDQHILHIINQYGRRKVDEVVAGEGWDIEKFIAARQLNDDVFFTPIKATEAAEATVNVSDDVVDITSFVNKDRLEQTEVIAQRLKSQIEFNRERRRAWLNLDSPDATDRGLNSDYARSWDFKDDEFHELNPVSPGNTYDLLVNQANSHLLKRTSDWLKSRFHDVKGAYYSFMVGSVEDAVNKFIHNKDPAIAHVLFDDIAFELRKVFAQVESNNDALQTVEDIHSLEWVIESLTSSFTPPEGFELPDSDFFKWFSSLDDGPTNIDIDAVQDLIQKLKKQVSPRTPVDPADIPEIKRMTTPAIKKMFSDLGYDGYSIEKINGSWYIVDGPEGKFHASNFQASELSTAQLGRLTPKHVVDRLEEELRKLDYFEKPVAEAAAEVAEAAAEVGETIGTTSPSRLFDDITPDGDTPEQWARFQDQLRAVIDDALGEERQLVSLTPHEKSVLRRRYPEIWVGGTGSSKKKYGIAMQQAIEYERDLAAATLAKSLGPTRVRRTSETVAFTSLDNLTWEDWNVIQRAFEERAGVAGLNEMEMALARMEPQDIDPRLPLPPPGSEGTTHSIPAAIYENIEGLRDMKSRISGAMQDNWDAVERFITDDAMRAELDRYKLIAKDRVAESRIITQQVANAAREFTLLDYNKRVGLDLVAGYLYPYHFWYSRTYKNWLWRLAQNPGTIAAYSKYKEALSQINAGAPEWWRNNLRVDLSKLGADSFLGIDLTNPLFFNLEATLNPLNGMIGMDFNDPNKRLGFWTKTLDDLGKLGPSTWTPFSIATAFALYSQGEKDAAARWAGRFIPQTATFRAGADVLGGFAGQSVDWEVDPFIHLFSGGYETYERGRIGRALGTLVDQGEITQEQAMDAARTEQGEYWDRAVDLALSQRSGGQLASFFMGVGFKGRTVSDMAIDVFYKDYRTLWAQEPMMSSEEFRVKMDGMRERYPFMDALLLARKHGLEQDRALAYNALSRIPPGMSTEIAELVGLPSEMLNKFYNDKGHIEDWTETDRDRFMAGIVDMSSVLAMPPNSTRAEWTAARNAYSNMRTEGEAMFGREVWQNVDMWYAAGKLPDDQKNALRNSLIAAYPNIEDALDWRGEAILRNPLLYDYYGGIDFYEQYYTGKIYDQIENQLGEGIWDTWDEYFRIKEEDQARYDALQAAGASTRGFLWRYRAYWSAHPELQRYTDLKERYMADLYTNMAELGDYLQAGGDDTISLRPDFADAGMYQQQLANQLAPQVVPWQAYQQVLGPHASELLVDYFVDGEELPSAVVTELVSLAQAMGVDIGTLMMQMQQSFEQGAIQSIP